MFRTISFVVPYGRNATDICHLVVIIGCRVSLPICFLQSNFSRSKTRGIWIILVSNTVMDLEVFGFQHYFWPRDTF